MFVDFNRVFKNKPQTEIAVPQALVNYLNQSLPKGVKYTVDEYGNCVITSEAESYTIGGFIFQLTEEQKKELGKNYTQKDVANYFYNLQKPIPLTLSKEGFILLNGEEFPIDKMYYNPLAPIKYVSGSFCLFPHKFPEPFHIKIGCDKYERDMEIARVPNDSVTVAAFESKTDEPLFIKYFFDEKTKKLSLSISLNLRNAKSIRDIVESISIYNAFLDGKGFLVGRPLDSKITNDTAKRFDKNSIDFWEKVLAIEEVLEVAFCPPQENIDMDTVCLVEQLFQNLVLKTPIRDRHIINSIDIDPPFAKSEAEIKKIIGVPMYFEFDATFKMQLFGRTKQLPSLIGVFNAVLSDYKVKGKKHKLILDNESKEKQRYTVILCFKNEEELKKFKEMDHNERITLFHDAKKTQEYL
ncbi:MAG: abortive infection system toxin AbiGii family protein [Candidatus Fimenecus sp.]